MDRFVHPRDLTGHSSFVADKYNPSRLLGWLPVGDGFEVYTHAHMTNPHCNSTVRFLGVSWKDVWLLG